MTFPPDFRLLLASRSPRRRDLLTAAGIPHHVVATTGEERVDPNDPLMTVEANALAKAAGAVVPADEPRPLFILGADTVVICEGEILGKPRDSQEAREMLGLLAGRSHTVVSGVSVRREDADRTTRYATGCAETTVWFRSLDSGQIEGYLDTQEWHDKAGGYGIQGHGGLLVERIEGEYSTVVGLPLGVVVALFLQQGFDLIARRWHRENAGGGD